MKIPHMQSINIGLIYRKLISLHTHGHIQANLITGLKINSGNFSDQFIKGPTT